jgi:dynein intermediate chain, cytosolic
VNNLVDSLVGPSRTLDSLGEFGTPLSSAPGTPLAPSLSLAAPSLSGRASRLSDVGSDRISLGTTLAGHSATEHVVDQ